MFRLHLLLVSFGVSFVALALPLRAPAQDRYSRFELGGQYSTIREDDNTFNEKNFSGFGGRFDWNINRRVAFESQVDFFPEHGVPLPLVQGGQTLQAVFGIRAKVIQNRHVSIFGLVRPGILHFTDALFATTDPENPLVTRPATYFVLNLGGGIEYYPSPRWILRFDIEGNPYRVPSTSNSIIAPLGKINDTTRMSFGAAYRLEKLESNEREINIPGTWEFGPLFSTMMIARQGSDTNPRTEPGFGGYVSYRFYGALYADGDLLYFPHTTAFSGPQDGGTILQGTFGLKGGIRRNHFGFFGKVRPGFHSYSQALATATDTSSGTTYTYTRSTNFALDLGGILEFYPRESGTMRIEVGDTHLYFGDRTFTLNGTSITSPGGKMQHTIQFIFGYGWRF